MNRLVAVKVLQAGSGGGEDRLRRFKREAKAVSILDHPNLVSFHDFGVLADGRPYLVMDLIEGTTLAEEIASQGSLPADRVVKIFCQAATALSHAHQQGIIHRDLKPGNIMLQAEQADAVGVKIVDFGVAWVNSADSADSAQSHQLSNSGSIIGSPSYMSPEQCLGRAVDARSDVYSLACVMYEALVGKPPFAGASPSAVADKQVKERLQLPEEVGRFPKIPEQLKAALIKATEKEPSKRFQSMSEFCQAINLCANRTSSVRPAFGANLACTRKHVLLTLGLLLLVLITVLLVSWSRSGEPAVLFSRVKLIYASVSGGPVDANLKKEIQELSRLQEQSGQLLEAVRTAQMLVESFDQEGLRYDPEKLDAQLRIADLLAKAGKPVESEKEYCKVRANARAGLMELSKRPKEDRAAKAQLFVRLIKALAKCSAAEKDELDEALQQVVGLYGLMGQTADKVIYQKQLLDLRRQTAPANRSLIGEACHELAQTYVVRGEKEKAYPLFVEACKLEKASPGESDLRAVLLDYGKLLFMDGKSNEALETLKAALQTAKSQNDVRPIFWDEVYSDLTYVFVGASQYRQGDLFMQAELRAVADPDRKHKREAVQRCLSVLSIYEGDFDRALAIFDQAFTSMTDEPKAHVFIGSYALEFGTRLDEAGKFKLAEQMYKKTLTYFDDNALTAKPLYPILVYSLGDQYFKQGKDSDAEREFARSLELAKERSNDQTTFVPRCLLSWSQLCARHQRQAQCESLLKECINKAQVLDSPDKAAAVTAFEDLLRAYINDSRFDQARKTFAEAQEFCIHNNLPEGLQRIEKEFSEKVTRSGHQH